MPARILVCVLLVAVSAAYSQDLKTRPPQAPGAAPMLPNSHPTYVQLRNLAVGNEAITVNNLVLKRDAATFTFRSGQFFLLAPVEGMITGAVFLGDGSLTLDPPLAVEKRSLLLLTKGAPFQEDFQRLVLRFADATEAELRKHAPASPATPPSDAAGLLKDIQSDLRQRDSMARYNLTGRILQDVLSGRPGGLFFAFIKGRKYNDKMLFALDPHGLDTFGIAPEEIALLTYDLDKMGVWAAFHHTAEYASGKASGTEANGFLDVESQKLDTTLERSGKLTGTAATTFVSLVDGLRVAPLDLFPTLRVQSVTDSAGQPLHFIQEDKDDDADFYIVLPQALKAGERFTVTTTYSGKDAVTNEGEGNYFPVARGNWYPAGRLGDFATFEMTFRIPKGLTMITGGVRLRDINEGNQNITDWRTEEPVSLVGFNFGKFKQETATVAGGFVVDAYANKEEPDWVRSLQSSQDLMELAGGRDAPKMRGNTLGSMSTVAAMKVPHSEAQLALMIYNEFFGPSRFKRLAISQQTACSFGQSFTQLVWLPMCVFYDQTIRHQLGLDDVRGYWSNVTAHEVAHQWWGSTVGWASYRDQWISEGFSELAASIFIQAAYEKDPNRFRKFWQDQHELLTERNKDGFRPIDVGPVTLGYRLGSSRAGFNIGQRVLYPKGGFILHMLRMMMWDTQKGDERFKGMLRDFTTQFAGKPASTEDFKAIVEKHMSPDMDRNGDRSMDWFFDEYVYGTALPKYALDYSFGNEADGGLNMHVKVTQSGVDPSFAMLVPLYMELADGRILRLGLVPMTGNKTFEQTVPLRGLPQQPKRVMLNYRFDVLAED